jgi:hypothetical protein
MAGKTMDWDQLLLQSQDLVRSVRAPAAAQADDGPGDASMALFGGATSPQTPH